MLYVLLQGEMSLDSAKSVLRALWDDPLYLTSSAVIYDVAQLGALPDVNEMLSLSRFVASHKSNRGPRKIAFVAPSFGERGMEKVFAGFARIVGFKLNFCPDRESALKALI